MTLRPSSSFVSRLARIRDAIRATNLDAFVVSHPPNIRYLTGFNGSAGILVLTPAAWVLLVDFRYVIAARTLLQADPGLGDVLTMTEIAASYDQGLIDLLRQSRAERIGIESVHMSVSRFNRLSTALADSAPTPFEATGPCPVLNPVERIVEQARLIKDEGEIETLREASRRLAAAAVEVPRFVQEGRSELDVSADIDALIRRLGFERPAFETIVASGPNGAHPHARPGRRLLQAGDGVVLDFGGVYDGYCVDLSRTVQLGTVHPEFRRIYDAVAEAQQAAIATVRPGVMATAVDAAARAVLDRYGLGDAFGHGTGHGLGLEVHEEPRLGRPVPGLPDVALAPGMIFTIEPGVYVEGFGGVRIEDDVLVTETGREVLTAAPI
jgi:Xaa-Pro aminopeptidase